MTGKIPSPNELLYELLSRKGLEHCGVLLFSRICQDFWTHTKKAIAIGEKPEDKSDIRGWRYDLEVTVAMPEKDFQPILNSFRMVAAIFGWDFVAINYEVYGKELLRITSLWIGDRKWEQ